MLVQSLNSAFPALYRGWTQAGEKRVLDNLHAHAQNKPIRQAAFFFLMWFLLNRSFLNKLLVLFKVFVILHGDDWISDPIELKSTEGKPLFERSSCDVFVHLAEWKFPCRGVGGQADLERWDILLPVLFVKICSIKKRKSLDLLSLVDAF